MQPSTAAGFVRPGSAEYSEMNDKIAASRALAAGQIAQHTGGGDLHPELSNWPELCISSRTAILEGCL